MKSELSCIAFSYLVIKRPKFYLTLCHFSGRWKSCSTNQHFLEGILLLLSGLMLLLLLVKQSVCDGFVLAFPSKAARGMIVSFYYRRNKVDFSTLWQILILSNSVYYLLIPSECHFISGASGKGVKAVHIPGQTTSKILKTSKKNKKQWQKHKI